MHDLSEQKKSLLEILGINLTGFKLEILDSKLCKIRSFSSSIFSPISGVPIGTFADDTVIMSRHYDPEIAAARVQEHLNLIQTWLQDWRIKVNETKCTQVNYTLRRSDCPHVYLNNIEIPRANVAKYLGLHLDSKMMWKEHIAKKKGRRWI